MHPTRKTIKITTEAVTAVLSMRLSAEISAALAGRGDGGAFAGRSGGFSGGVASASGFIYFFASERTAVAVSTSSVAHPAEIASSMMMNSSIQPI